MKINIEKLNVTIDKDQIINLENITFYENKINAVIGKNGKGKTTLLKSIANLIKYEGKILYNDSLYTEETQNNIVYIDTHPYMFNFSVYKNLILGLNFKKTDIVKNINKLNKYVNLFNLEKIISKNAKKLSSGEKVKVALVRGLLLEPKLLLLDEPTNNLDYETEQEVFDFIKKYQKSTNTTIIMVSHNIVLAKKISNHVFLLENSSTLKEVK